MNEMLVAKRGKKTNGGNKLHILGAYSGGGDGSYKQENSSGISRCFPSAVDLQLRTEMMETPTPHSKGILHDLETFSGEQLYNKINE